MNQHDHLGCGGCGTLLAIVSPNYPINKELEMNGGDIDSFLVLECPYKTSREDNHTRIIFDLKKIAESSICQEG